MFKRNYTALCFDLTSQVALDDGLWLPMIPSGVFSGRDGRTWNNNQPDIVVSTLDQKIPFDIEHATETRIGDTDAVGWILALQNRAGEIWARVEWNAKGREKIDEKKFAFYSPAFEYDQTGSITALVSAGLTNKPNLRVPALNREEISMPLPVLLTQALGLSADADEAQALTAINTLKSEHQVALNRANAGPDLTKFVPQETYQLAMNRATASETKLAEYQERESSSLVDDAIKAGKVAPANREMYLGLCRTEAGRQQFTSFVSTAPVIASSDPAQQGKQDKPQLAEHELAMCRKLGIKQDEYLAARKNMNTQGE